VKKQSQVPLLGGARGGLRFMTKDKSKKSKRSEDPASAGIKVKNVLCKIGDELSAMD
jgi:hypothetical protein